jgi:hypothetical protein
MQSEWTPIERLAKILNCVPWIWACACDEMPRSVSSKGINLMKKFVVAIGMIGALASCTPTEQGTAIGAGTGAIIGGAVTNSWGGAAVGAAAGGLVGNLIGRSHERQGYCVYRDRNGRRYEAPCQ